MSTHVPFWLVMPAAGVGARMQADRPKQYLDLAGKPLIEHSLRCFLGHQALLGAVVSVALDDPYWPMLAIAKDQRIWRAAGGVERADSVLNGLKLLLEKGAQPDDWVLVHDAARPNLTRSDLDLLLSTLADDAVGGLLAVAARDTLKQVDAQGRVCRTLDRRMIWQAYTPQMFRVGALYQALSAALDAGVTITDEASAMEWFGAAPRVVAGRADNLKVTSPEDLLTLSRHPAFCPAEYDISRSS